LSGAGARGARQRLDLFLTEACNLACPYCFAASGQGGQMSAELARQAVDWLVAQPAERLHITFWGGEPLLRRDLLRELIERAKRGAASQHKSITFSLPTNATLLDEQTAGWLADEGVHIFLSIDGDAVAQAERPRRDGGSSHAAAVAGLRAATAAQGRAPAVRMTLAPRNAGRAAESVAFFAAEGVREVLAYAAFDQRWSESELADFARGQRELARWLVDAIRASVDPRREVPRLRAWIPILQRLQRGSRRRRAGTLRHCGAGDELLALRVDGRWAPCHRFVFYDDRGAPRYDGGTLEAPAASAAIDRLGTLQIEQLEGETRCIDCDLFDVCTIGCVAIGVGAAGGPEQIPPVACRLQREQVAACRQVSAELGDDARLAHYLGREVRDMLGEAAARIGASAHRRYLASRGSTGPARGEGKL
jgi:uncharacterized protein